MNLFRHISEWFVTLFKVWRREFRLVFTDVGVLIFFFGLTSAYPVVYSLIYNPEIVVNEPIVVVDNCRTPSSRELARAVDATQAIAVAGYAANMTEAREAWHNKDCYGILLIPSDYDKRLKSGGQGVVTFYSDMSLLLRYRAFLLAMTDVQIDQTLKITQGKIDDLGLPAESVTTGELPVNTESVIIGDVSQGFASFVMPGMVVLILQQSMILGIAMLAGNRAERRRRNRGYDPMGVEASAVTTVMGRSLCYVVTYLPIAYYILQFVPDMFAFPHVSSPKEFMTFIFPMLVATSLLGQTVGVFVTERESSLLVVVFTSVVFLFLSGLTWPRYAFSGFWKLVSDFIPSTWGVEGFIRMTSDGATIYDVGYYYKMMWVLSGLYFVTSSLLVYAYGRIARKSGAVAAASDQK